jgi:large subunit ribosomal protein L6
VSRIGQTPIPLPEGVRVNIQGSQVAVTGPKGNLSREFHPDMEIGQEGGQLVVHRPTDQRHHKALHGLTRALLNNMVIGVTQGFQKQLEVQGVGYRVDLQGDGGLVLQLTVSGIDKELVGQVAAEIRAWRPPEPYKGKGIRYVGEYVRRKAGKAGKIG